MSNRRCSVRRLMCLAAAVAVTLLPRLIHAVSTGITGNSGKQGANCTDCHSGGTEPLVRLEGPSSVYAGALASFRFIVQTQSSRQQFAGFNVAVSHGRLFPEPFEGEHLEVGELTHDSPKAASDDETSWAFTWRVPSTAGIVTLFGAGLSCNLNGTRSGDAMALLQFDITVDDNRPGDANCDKALSAADLTGIVTGGGDCGLADADCSGTVDAVDVDVLIAQLFDSPV